MFVGLRFLLITPTSPFHTSFTDEKRCRARQAVPSGPATGPFSFID
jgi:hypothetical protein